MGRAQGSVSTCGSGGGTIGQTAGRFTTATTPLVHGVLVQADPANGGTIYVGLSSSVSATAGNANNGHALAAGKSVTIPCDDLSSVYLIASAASQNYTVVYA